MTQELSRRLGEHAARRHGVFTRGEARKLGLPDSTLTDHASGGRFRKLEPGVYSIVGSPASRSQQMAAVVASFPDLAALSHQTAAELWGLTDRSIRLIEVVTTRWDRVRRTGATVHESLDLIAEDVVERDGLLITVPARTVVDLGASNRWIVEHALEQGIRRDLFTLGEVEAFVARVGRRGRRGVGVIRPLLAARRRWDGATESALEDRFRKLVAGFALREPRAQYVLRDERGGFVCRADFAYIDERVLIELDSEAYHLDRLSFRRDRAKQNRATVLGWTMLRYTWWDLLEEPGRVRSEILAALEVAPPS